MRVISNIRVGKPDTTPSKSAHLSGVRQGNEPGSLIQQPGHFGDGRVDARRSTGVNPEPKNPIDARSPNLPPA